MTLTEYLAQKGHTASNLAGKLGVAHTTVLRWAQGRVPVDRVAEVASATGIPAAELRPDLAQAFSVAA
jgi:DNA-binding transcriptional regulator YdaS (Cro superfamily)